MKINKKIILRGLWIGIGVGLLISGFMVWHYRSSSPPVFPIPLPDQLAWSNRTVTKLPDGTERALIERFSADGRKFRLEVALPDKPPVIWVFNGERLAVNTTVPEKSVADLDSRTTIYGLYASFPDFQYKGTRSVGPYQCWYFKRENYGVETHVWVDTFNHLPRQILLRYEDGRTDTQTYTDLKLAPQLEPILYDLKRLNPILMRQGERVQIQNPGSL